MKKIFISMMGMLMAISMAYSQKTTIAENFDGNTVSFIPSPAANAWIKNNNYSSSAPSSYWGIVPHQSGDSIVLTTPPYNFQNYPYIMLRFSHICKVSPSDKVSIEYRLPGQGWKVLSASFYLGKASNYASSGFNANSYPDWKGTDSTALPDLSWWKDEIFDVSNETSMENGVQFRFVLKKGSTLGSQVSYGWLIDNFEIMAATYPVDFPVVEFVEPLVKGQIYYTGPWEINARVKSTTSAPIKTPVLKFMGTRNGIQVTPLDSVDMTPVEGDSLWKANIPQFEAGTEVTYYITGIDTAGSYATAMSGYTIQKPPKAGGVGNAVIGQGTLTTYYSPYFSNYDRSWTRSIYYENEFNPAGTGALISSLAYNNSATGTSTVDRLSMYVKPTQDASITVVGYVDPIADGATLVWGEATQVATQGWNTFTFQTPFYLPPGYNLMVYWINNDGSYSDNGNMPLWYATGQQNENHIRAYQDGNPNIPTLVNVIRDTIRPDITISMRKTNFPDYSVAMHSIDINDTVSVVPGLVLPVIATIKNMGDSNLRAARIHYSVNGIVQPAYDWNGGNLSWDMNQTITIGNYNPRPNRNDTIVVWVSLPNGVTDGETYDDTLTKIIYGNSDILISFVNPPADTVHNTGPFNISARIQVLTGPPVGPPSGAPVILSVDTIYNGITTHFTLPMTFDATDNLWKTTIPHTLLGSDVVYSITFTDVHNNVASIEGRFHIKLSDGGTSEGYVIAGTETETFSNTPIDLYWQNNWSRQLYLGSELAQGAAGGTISKLAWDYAGTTPYNLINQTCYMRAVDETEITSSDWEDPSAVGADQVWSGPLSITTGWVEIDLDQDFMLPPGKNLLVYWEHAHGTYYTSEPWNHTQTPNNTVAYSGCDCGGSGWNPNDAYSSGLSDYRPNARFYVTSFPLVDTSVALAAIESPISNQVANTTIPVQVRIRNKGLHNLKDCDIYWRHNETSYPPFHYMGDLPTDFTALISLGSYTPSVGVLDTIVVWVSMPNGIIDEYSYDDTLQIISYGCNATFAGTKRVGAGEEFATVTDAINLIRRCGMTADLTLLLKDTLVENIDLTNLTPYMNGYHLTITSVGNHRDSAVIKPADGAAITLGNTNNVTVKNITIDATTATAGINFTRACTNIVIRDCNLLADSTTTLTQALIYKAYSTGIVDNISIINNRLHGGYNGIEFIGGRGDLYDLPIQHGKNVVIDSNIVTSQSYYGIHTRLVDFTSFSHNTVLSRYDYSYFYTSWYAINLYLCNGPVIANRAIQRAPLGYPYGMTFSYYNYVNTRDTGLIANNEVILNNELSSYYGALDVSDSRAKILHNSIYVSGAGEGRGIYLNSVSAGALKNNNIVMQGELAYPVYFPSGMTNLDVDYNNYYAPTYIGYYGGAISSMSDWRQTLPTDQHSVRIYIPFIDPSTNLLFEYDRGLAAPLIPSVTQDINGIARDVNTTIGCYEIQQPNKDLKLEQISAWDNEVIINQTVQVSVDVTNLGLETLSGAVFGWSLNNELQSTTIQWTAPPALPSLGQTTISIGTFVASGHTAFNVVVWVETINGQKDLVNWNDTVSATTTIVPLAEFSAPFIQDTISDLAFTVNTLIRSKTGAPSPFPVMTLRTVVNGGFDTVLTVTMVPNGNIWQAHIPPQYYGSMVYFSTTIYDTIGNSIPLSDSTYIRFLPPFGDDTIRIVGAGVGTDSQSPYYGYAVKGWTRSIYMDWEINPAREGGKITQIAYYNRSNYSSVVDNLSMYFKGVSESTITTSMYVDPVADGATLVWGSATSIVANSGWIVFTLHTPFYLNPNSNLMVYWNNEDGNSNNNGDAPQWEYSQATSKNICSYGYDIQFPTTTNINRNDNRPNARFTIFGSEQKYAGYNLSITALTEPVNKNIGGTSCSEEYVPLKIILANTGENDYDFSINPVTLTVDVGNAISYTLDKPLDGILKSGSVDTIEITPVFPVYMPGQYDIKVWLTSLVDRIPFDDTLKSVYISERLALPLDEEFNSGSFPSEFTVRGVNNPSTEWKIVSQGSGADAGVLPAVGNMLAFTGTKGSLTHLATRQLELRGTILPLLEFWYFHDTIDTRDYTDVFITTDGGETYTLLLTVTKQNAVYGWKRYEAYLTSFIGGECTNILFESMQMSSGDVTQYIDRIRISSSPDLKISNIVISPEVTACDLTGKTLSVVVGTSVNQNIDFSQTPTDLIVSVPGYQQPFIVPLTGVILGNDSITVPVDSNINILKGASTIRAYFSPPVDDYSVNDTLDYPIDLRPSLSVTVSSLTGGKDCFSIGAEVEQEVILKNTGNIDLSGIEMVLHLIDYPVIIKENGTIDLAAGEDTVYSFKSKYTVPAEASYRVRVTAYLGCDSVWVNQDNGADECADIHNVALTDFVNPPKDRTTDIVDSREHIIVSIRNESDVKRYPNATIMALIEDANGTILSSRIEFIPEITPNSTMDYTFTEAYTVPNTPYSIRVYISGVDNYSEDDTLFCSRSVNVGINPIGETNAFTLAQNIPNPANNSTRINYSVPEAGEVVFHVHSISGQLLYSKTINAERGAHSLELNTSTLSAGVYYYSIEYKGQRLVKQLGITK